MKWLKREWQWVAMVAALAVALAVIYGGFHARYGLFDVDEAIFTQATGEMVNSATYSMPSYNGVPRYQKPPLIYWVQAAFMQVLGTGSLWAARLPSALFALLTIGLLGWSVWRFTGNRAWALTAAAALGLNLSFVVVGRAATADGVLNFFMLALAVWTLRQIYGAPYKGDWVLGGVLVALGLLAKGPVAGVSAALVALPLLIARPDRWALFWKLQPFKVLAVAVVGLVPWVILLAQEGMLGFFGQFILVENLQRFGNGLTNTQSGSPLYYLVVVAIGFMPWAFVLPRTMWEASRGWLGRLHSPDIREALPVLAVLWAAGIIMLFSLSGTKLAHYIVPAYPALALLVGWWLADEHSRTPRLGAWAWWWASVQVGVLALVLLLLGPAMEGLQQPILHGGLGWAQVVFGFAWPPEDVLTRAVLMQNIHVGNGPMVAGVLLALVGLAVGLLGGKDRRRAIVAVAAAMAGFLMVVVVGIVPVVWAYTQAGLAQVSKQVAALPPDVRVIHLGLHKPSVLYLSHRPFLKLERAFQLPTSIPPLSRAAVVIEQADVPTIAPELGETAIISSPVCSGGYCLVLIDRVGK